MRLRVALAEVLNDLKTLYELSLLLSCCVGDLLPERVRKQVEIQLLNKRLHAVGSDPGTELLIIFAACPLLMLEDYISLIERRRACAYDEVARVVDDFLMTHHAELSGILLFESRQLRSR